MVCIWPGLKSQSRSRLSGKPYTDNDNILAANTWSKLQNNRERSTNNTSIRKGTLAEAILHDILECTRNGYSQNFGTVTENKKHEGMVPG